MPLDPPPGVLGDDPELASLELALSTAGAGARNATPAAPTPVFTSTLRARLLGELAAVDDRTRAALGDVAMPGSAAADRTRLQPVAARTTWRLPTILPAPRAFALAMAAVLVIGLLGIGTLRLLPTTLDGTVVAATDAQLVRDGTAVALVEGTALHAGDVVAVASGGNATLAIDRGETRLTGGAELRIVTLARGAISLEQLAGRVWHRVAVPDGTSYRVSTGMVEWTALGTAFDLERTVQPGGDEIVHAIGIEHAVRVAGPDLAATVDAGREATVVLRAGAAIDLAVDDLDPANLVDPWLLGNARRDVGLGFDAGLLAAIEMPASPSPAPSVAPSNPASSPSPSPEPSPEPSLSPAPSASPAPSPSPSPTPEPSPKATPKPSPKPSPTPTPTPSPAIGTLTLDLQSCPGGVVLDWSPSTSERFGHYSVLRGTASFETPASYPPEPPVTAVDGTFTTDRDVTASRDASGTADTKYFYRALAFDAEDRVIAASPLKSATARAIKALGALDAVPGAGQVELGWTPYGGTEACFTYYKVVWSTTTKTPSYLGEHDGAIPLGSQSDASLTVDGLEPGAYWLRVQAIRTTDLGKFIVAQTSVAKVLVP